MRQLKLLTILCCAVTLALAGAVSAAVDKVICVPWQGDINKYHTTVSGLSLEMKGVIKTTNTATVWYKWVFGDGTESSVLGVALSGSTKYNVQVNHTYTGAESTPFTAKLLVDCVDKTMANAVSDNYLVKIEADNLDAKINMAIDRGLWTLYKNAVTSYGSYHTLDGSPYAVWSYGGYYGSPTASAIHAFQINGHKETGNFNEDPYAEVVQLGFNWLFNGYYSSTSFLMLRTLNIGPVPGGNPDSRPKRWRIVSASSSAWVGCWWAPSPALITEQSTFWESSSTAPATSTASWTARGWNRPRPFRNNRKDRSGYHPPWRIHDPRK